MVHSDQDEKFAGTYRKLFDTIERGVEQCTTDRLQTLLEEKKEQLKLGLEAFGEPSSQARNKINNDSTVTVDGKQIKLQKNEKDLVLNLSDILQLNELTCASLWNTYKQINSDLVTRLTETKDGQEPPLAENTQLIMNVINFYYEDRLSLLECIGSLLRISMDDSHLYTSIATNTIQKLRQDDSTNPFIERLFSQFSKLTRSSVPSRTHSFSNWAVVWAKQNLKEQKAILEIIFLLTLTEPISPKLILSFIQEFEADCFGYLQAFGYVLDEEGIALRESVTALCMILSANIIVPPTLKLGAKLDAALRNTSLIDTPDVIAKINQVVAYLGTRQEHSVFLLAWSFFLTCVDTAIHSDGPVDPAYTEVNHVLEGKQNISASVLINRPSVNGTEFDNDRVISIKQSPQLDRIYLGRSLKLNVFDSIAYILESNVCSEEDVNNYGYRAVFKTLLNSFLSTTRPHYIPVNTYASLVNSYCLTYNNQQSLSRSFWAEDFDKENPFSLLATARGRFPVFFSDLIQLLAALSGGPNDETDNGDTVSAAYVYEYLAHLSTITVILPSSVNITAFEENGEVIIQADQAIQVTAKNDTVRSITIPEGTCGSLLNKDENDRVVQFQVNYSGWHLLTAVLGSFLTEYNVNAIDIKDEEKNIHGKNPEAIYNVLALIHNVLSSSPKLVVKLVEHIEQASASTDSSSPTLVSALFKILNYCSTIKPYPVSILTLTLKCLTLLIPEYRDCIWRHLKHAHMLPTANTTYHLSTGYNAYSSNPSSQIQEIVSKFECTIGRYTFLLSFLDFVQALVYDVQRKWWDKNALDYHSQVEVLYICLYYLMSDVFPSYSKWRYKKVSERFLIGTKVLSILITIASDFKEHETVQGKLTLKTIREGIFNNFLYDGGIYHISPLVDTISEGAKTANALYNSSHPKEAHRIEKLTELTFIFVKILLQHRLEQINEGGALSESTLERLLLERSSASNSSDFLLRVARHINYRHNIALPIQATNVLTLLCRTTSFWKSAPNFVQFLGSTDQIHGIVRTYLGIAKDHSQNESLLAAIWQFITTLMETQPSLAILFLDCGDFIMPSPKSAVRLLSGETKPAASAPVTPTHESAIRASVDILSHWETLSIEKPTATSNALRFLATFWKTAFDHYALVERARVDNALWDVLGKVLLNLTSDMDISNDQIHNANMLESMNNTHYDNQVRQRCCLNLSKAFVMRIIVYEIHLTAGRSGSSDISEKIPVGLKNLMNKINEPSKLTSMRDTFVKNDFNPTVVHSAEFSAEQCVQMLAAGDASMLLFKMSRLGSGDDGEAGENRQYGDAYLYDYHLAATKIKSLYAEMKVKYEHAMMDDVIVTPEVKAVLELRDNANKFLQNLLLANHNTSIVDSQVILLRAYKTFIEATSRRASDLIWANKTGTSGTDSLYQFLKGLIQHAQQENRADGVALTSYSILMQFIRHLIEDWISKNSAIVVGVNAAEKKAYSDKAFELLSSLCGLLNRENYALFNSICDRTAIRFHRPLLESILLCLRTLNGNVGSTNDLTTLLNVVCSSFNVLVIKATSYSAVGSDVSEEVAENCIKDVTVVTSLLQEMISPKYKLLPEVWLDIFEKSNTIPAVLSLFYRGLEVLVKEVQGHSNGLHSLNITPYAETALYLLLSLSSIPKAAERLIKYNIFDSLCNNTLTAILQRGSLDLFIRFGDANKTGPAYVERNPLHSAWCQILGVVNNILRTRGSCDLHVLQFTVSFLQMYGAQIGTAFSNANGAKDSIFGLTASESLSSPLLEELEHINKTFYELSKHLEKIPNMANNLFISFKDCSLFLLQRYLYYFTHPSHMQAQLYPVDNIERQQVQTFISEESSTRTSQLMRNVSQKILNITHHMLTTLIVLTNADIVLTEVDTEWPFGNTIIYPDMRVTVGESASFGTLIECMSVCIAMIGQWKGVKDYSIQELLNVIQDCALLLTTQVALWVAKPNIKDELRLEIAQENLIDVVEALNKTGSSLKKLDEQTHNIKSKLKLIHLLQSFLGNRYFEKN